MVIAKLFNSFSNFSDVGNGFVSGRSRFDDLLDLNVLGVNEVAFMSSNCSCFTTGSSEGIVINLGLLSRLKLFSGLKGFCDIRLCNSCKGLQSTAIQSFELEDVPRPFSSLEGRLVRLDVLPDRDRERCDLNLDLDLDLRLERDLDLL